MKKKSKVMDLLFAEKITRFEWLLFILFLLTCLGAWFGPVSGWFNCG